MSDLTLSNDNKFHLVSGVGWLMIITLIVIIAFGNLKEIIIIIPVLVIGFGLLIFSLKYDNFGDSP